MIIDSHVHVGWANNNHYDGRKLKILLEKNSVDLALVSSLSVGTISQRYGNEETYKFVKKNKKRFMGLVWVNPYDPEWKKDAKKWLRKGFIGIKLHSSANRYKIDFDFLRSIFVFAVQYNVPVFAHTDDQKKWHAADNFRELLDNFPKIKLILYHSGLMTEAVDLVLEYENVYLETAGLDIERVREMVSRVGSGRVIFGSDAPIGFKGFASLKSKFESLDYSMLLKDYEANFSGRDYDNIFCNNIKKICQVK